MTRAAPGPVAAVVTDGLQAVRALGGRPAPAHVVTYRPLRARTPALTAALRAARRAGAEVVVCGPRAAGRAGTRGCVLLDPVTGLAASGQPAPSPFEGVGEHVPR